MSKAFKDARGIVHAMERRFDHPCSFPDGMATLKAPCGKRLKHHDQDMNRLVVQEVDCMACVVQGDQDD
jgi:hypothetical protein